ncbi:MAG: type II toxin-antitoxin system HipA family toxin [Clostridia bacterium]|nr:type II toxin-antitoxin system HipA family toxin [Clostridia bacterium]
MIPHIKKLTVKYNDIAVGYLGELEDYSVAFQYDGEWLASGFSVSPLSLPLTSEVFVNRDRSFSGLYGVFNDSLPDGWGILLLVKSLRRQGVNYSDLSPLTKLALVQENGLGGLTYEPTLIEENIPSLVTLDAIAKDARKVFDLNDISDVDIEGLCRIGSSSGGARPKAHILMDGAEWIIKFPCRMDPDEIGSEEYRTNTLARDCGINVNECRLFPSDVCGGYFGAKRFDREGAKRIHTVSLSGMFETRHDVPSLDYRNLFALVRHISVNPREDTVEAFRRMTFNVLYGNRDDHGKNFAFIYSEKENGYRLSPAYDLTPTPDKDEHEMTVNRKPNPTAEDLVEVGTIYGLGRKFCNRIIDDMKQKIS